MMKNMKKSEQIVEQTDQEVAPLPENSHNPLLDFETLIA